MQSIRWRTIESADATQSTDGGDHSLSASLFLHRLSFPLFLFCLDIDRRRWFHEFDCHSKAIKREKRRWKKETFGLFFFKKKENGNKCPAKPLRQTQRNKWNNDPNKRGGHMKQSERRSCWMKNKKHNTHEHKNVLADKWKVVLRITQSASSEESAHSATPLHRWVLASMQEPSPHRKGLDHGHGGVKPLASPKRSWSNGGFSCENSNRRHWAHI